MKINGKPIDRPKPEPVILPRNGNDIVFLMGPVLNGDEFEQYCKEPQPPMCLKRGEGEVPFPDLKDADYLKAVQLHSKRRLNWMVLQSFKATENLEWETVKDNDPDTWMKWEEELKRDGLSQLEINMIWEAFMSANAMSESKMKEARERFYHSQVDQPKA